jgi:hypothetical protein
MSADYGLLTCAVGSSVYICTFLGSLMCSWAIFTLLPRMRRRTPEDRAGGDTGKVPPWTPMLSQMTAVGREYAVWLCGAAISALALVASAAGQYISRRSLVGTSNADNAQAALALSGVSAVGLFLLAFFSGAWAKTLHLIFAGVFIAGFFAEIVVSTELSLETGSIGLPLAIVRFATGVLCYVLLIASFALSLGAPKAVETGTVRVRMRWAAATQYGAIAGHLVCVGTRAYECGAALR